jgi:hypothetical protein
MFQNAKNSLLNAGSFSETAYETAANQARLEYYTNDASREKNSKWYWEASPSASGVASFCTVLYLGRPFLAVPGDVGGCAPAFCIK